MTQPARATSTRQIVRSTFRADWAQFEGRAAVRCTAGVAIPLLAGGLLRDPSLAAFGAVGAVSVGFGSFQGAYRSRAAVMIWASVGMALAIAVGSLTGSSTFAAIVTATLAAFAGGMLLSLGPAGAFVGLQVVVAVLIAGGFPADLHGAAMRAVDVLLGGVAQTLLVVLIWPLRRFSAERRTIGAAYHSIAGYAAQLQEDRLAAPEPHTFAGTMSPFADPQPFARRGDVLVFQALLDEAERIRASLAAVATRQRDFLATHPQCASSLAALSARALDEIALALEDGRAPREGSPIWVPIARCAGEFPDPARVDALLGQLRSAWRTAGLLADGDGTTSPGNANHPEARHRPPLRDALTTLRANMTLQSATCRHAVRVAVTVCAATAAYKLSGWSRGYWIPMTAVLVLKPEFQDTYIRALSRVGGTLLGAAFATVVVNLFQPGPAALTVLVLAFVWGCYALFRINYAIFSVCLTAYVVFILMLSGVAEMTAATLRAEFTIGGGALAMLAYALWPTWAGSAARESLASMLEAHAVYVGALLDAYATPAAADLRQLAQMRTDARLARSNTEALVERMLAEPSRRATLSPRAAVGVLAALRRHALAALALHAGIERGIGAPVTGVAQLRTEIVGSLVALAATVRTGVPSPPMPALRATQLALPAATAALVGEETDLMVDAVNTMIDLLGRR